MSSGGAIVFLVIWIGLIVAGYYVGKSKGRVALGIILTIILGLIGLIIVACLPKTAAAKAAEAQQQYGLQPGPWGQYGQYQQGQGQYGQYQDPNQYGQYPQQGQGQYPQQGQGQYGQYPQGQGQYQDPNQYGQYPQQGQGQYQDPSQYGQYPQGQGQYQDPSQYPQQGQEPYPSSAPTQQLPVQREQPPPPDQ